MDYKALWNNRKIQLVLLVAAISLFAVLLRDFNPSTLDVNLGIEFVGGVRIPVMLEKPVDSTTMDLMVETIKNRINKFGLSQAIVRPVGDGEILVEIPQAAPGVIKNIEEILKQQGSFEGIIDGKTAITGADIITNAVGGSNNEGVIVQDSGVSWYIGFAATKAGADKFANAALGKAYFPIYMFLDRPANATIIVDEAWYNNSQAMTQIRGALTDALRKEGDDLTIIYSDEFSNRSLEELRQKSILVIEENFAKENPSIYSQVVSLGYRVQSEEQGSGKRIILRKKSEMLATTYVTEQGETVAGEWPAVGLLSAPTLSPGLAGGFASQFYQVTGSASGSTLEGQRANAVSEIRLPKTVISGGRLPVSTFIGSSYSVAPSLGRQFLFYSAIGIILSVAIVAALIILRYRKLLLIVPIVVINVIEMLVTLAVVGTFGTLDLAAMAGVITLIGTGVDDQIIITDELLRKRKTNAATGQVEPKRSVKDRIGRAFEIVFTVASVAIATMLPLFLSGIVEITGFALSYIIGVLVGVSITRPAFGVLVGQMFGEKADE